MRVLSSLPILLAAMFVSPAPHAQEVVIYRCTDGKGALTFQNNMPCPKGTRQERRIVQPAQTVATPASVAVPPPLATITRAEAAPATETQALDPAPTIDDADRLPPPPLFQCNTYDNDSYLSDSAEAAPRCIRLQTTGIDGNAETGVGEACQMVTDQCQRVPDAAACDAWKKRLKEVEATWRFARAADKEANQAEFKRVAQMLRDSSCRI